MANNQQKGDVGADSVEEQNVLATFHWILSSYEPPRHDGPADIFLTDEQESFAPFLRRKWLKSAPQAEIHRIEGKHLGSITTNVEKLAAQIDHCLKRS